MPARETSADQQAMIADGMSIASAGRDIRAGRTSARQLTEQCLAVIAARSHQLNAFISVAADSAREQAAIADREMASGLDRGPLHGIPVSLKDLIDVAGVPTSAASGVRAGHVASHDAVVVTRLRQAGAVLVGKTNLHEFALGTTNEDSAYGPGRHPLDDSRSSGGSSGGSAISVATGMAFASVGTDTGGSIRIPAAACGVVGLKPAYGEIPVDGIVPLSSSLDHVGPLCRTAEDAELVYDALLASSPSKPGVRRRQAHEIRLGVPRAYFLSMMDSEVAGEFEAACARLADAGAVIREVTIAQTELIGAVYLHVSLPEAVAYHAATLEQMPERYTPAVRGRLEAGRYLLAEDYVRAQRGRVELRASVEAALEGCDALLLPTLPIPAPTIGVPTITIGGKEELVRNVMLRLTQLFNITGHPAIAMPCGSTRAGLPVSAQLVGHSNQTPSLLAVARALEPHLSLPAN